MPERKFPPLLHAHLLGKKLGGFEVFWDAAAAEPLWAGQPRMKDDILFFDVWTSFAPAAPARAAFTALADDASITAFHIQAIGAASDHAAEHRPRSRCRIRSGGERTLLFELSRYLKVDAVEADGRAVDFIQNPAIEGTAVARKGNDLVAVVFPAPLAARPATETALQLCRRGSLRRGKRIALCGRARHLVSKLRLEPGAVRHGVSLSRELDAGGDRKTDFTRRRRAKPETTSRKNRSAGPEKVSRWISERPIPVAGFNLGKYVRAESKAGNILVEALRHQRRGKIIPQGAAGSD